MIIFPYKEKFIQKNFIEYSFENEKDEYLPDFKLFEKLNSTEQYYLAKNYNWDDGVEVLKWIIDSPKCDKGTASLIFWTSEPDFYIERSEQNIPEYEKNTFLLLRKIVEKFKNNEFKKSKLKFDPTERLLKIDWSKQNSEWDIPNELKRHTKGFTPISLGMIQNSIWEWQRKRRLAKREAKKQKRKKQQ